MVRFAVAATFVMLVLTATAGFMLTRVETPLGDEFLKSDDLSAMGLQVTSFKPERHFLPMAVTRHQYTSDCAVEGKFVAVSGEVRVGDGRATFDQVVALERANAKNPHRPPENTYEAKFEPPLRDGTETFVVVRAYPSPRGGQASAEVWMLDGTTFIRARVGMTEVASAELTEWRRWCERKAGAIAGFMLGQVRDSRPK